MSALDGVSPVTTYISSEKDEQAAAARYLKTDSGSMNSLKNFESEAKSIHSASDFMNNYSVEKVVLDSYGLDSLLNEPAVVKDLLTQDPSSSKSLARSSGNAAWLSFADDFKSLGSNKGKASQSTELSMRGPVGEIPLVSSQTMSQTYSTPTATAHTANGDAYQIGLTWTQSSDDPYSWTVSAYGYSNSSSDIADASGSFNVTFNSDGSLGSVTDIDGTVMNKPGEQAIVSVPASYDGDAQNVTLNFGTIGQSNGASLSTSFDSGPSSNMNPLVLDSKHNKITQPVGTTIGGVSGDNQSYLTPPLTVTGKASDGSDESASVSARWIQSNNIPPTWDVAIVDPTTGTRYSDVYSVKFDSDGNISSAEDLTQEENSSVVDPYISADMSSIPITLNGQSYKVDLSNTKLSSNDYSDMSSPQNVLTASYSSTPFSDNLINTISDNYELHQFEGSKANKSNGVGDALYFTRKIGSVTSINQLMSDPKLLQVAEVVSGYDPSVIGGLDFDQQYRILSSKVDLKKLSNPKDVQQYAERYLTLLQNNPDYNLDNSDNNNTIIDLFGGSSGDSYEDQIVSLFG